MAKDFGCFNGKEVMDRFCGEGSKCLFCTDKKSSAKFGKTMEYLYRKLLKKEKRISIGRICILNPMKLIKFKNLKTFEKNALSIVVNCDSETFRKTKHDKIQIGFILLQSKWNIKIKI